MKKIKYVVACLFFMALPCYADLICGPNTSPNQLMPTFKEYFQKYSNLSSSQKVSHPEKHLRSLIEAFNCAFFAADHGYFGGGNLLLKQHNKESNSEQRKNLLSVAQAAAEEGSSVAGRYFVALMMQKEGNVKGAIINYQQAIISEVTYKDNKSIQTCTEIKETSQYNLAKIYEEKEGIYDIIGEDPDIAAQTLFLNLFRKGKFLAKNALFSLAFMFSRELRDSNGCYDYARKCPRVQGLFSEAGLSDLAGLVGTYRWLCDEGAAEACHNLAWIAQETFGDLAVASRFYHEASKLGIFGPNVEYNINLIELLQKEAATGKLVELARENKDKVPVANELVQLADAVGYHEGNVDEKEIHVYGSGTESNTSIRKRKKLERQQQLRERRHQPWQQKNRTLPKQRNVKVTHSKEVSATSLSEHQTQQLAKLLGTKSLKNTLGALFTSDAKPPRFRSMLRLAETIGNVRYNTGSHRQFKSKIDEIKIARKTFKRPNGSKLQRDSANLTNARIFRGILGEIGFTEGVYEQIKNIWGSQKIYEGQLEY